MYGHSVFQDLTMEGSRAREGGRQGSWQEPGLHALQQLLLARPELSVQTDQQGCLVVEGQLSCSKECYL